MVLTSLFVVTGLVGAVVLAMEVGTVIRRRRAERRWREERREARDDRSY